MLVLYKMFCSYYTKYYCILFLLSLFQLFASIVPQKLEIGSVVRAEEASSDGGDGGGPELEIHFYPLGYGENDGEHQVSGSGDVAP